MKKYLQIIILSSLILTFFVGCGNKEDDNNLNTSNNNNNNNEKITDKTKVNNLSESYAKYVELKGQKLDAINNAVEDNESLSLTMAMLGLATVDLTTIPATMCGLDESIATSALILYSNVKYKMNGSVCTITFTNAQDDEGKFVADYDKKTDSTTMSIYENDNLIMINEYTKIKDGYATLTYTIEEGKGSVYKTYFDKDNIFVSFFEDVSKPESIFKNNDLTSDYAKNGDAFYFEIVDGVASGTIDGQPIDLVD